MVAAVIFTKRNLADLVGVHFDHAIHVLHVLVVSRCKTLGVGMQNIVQIFAGRPDSCGDFGSVDKTGVGAMLRRGRSDFEQNVASFGAVFLVVFVAAASYLEMSGLKQLLLQSRNSRSIFEMQKALQMRRARRLGDLFAHHGVEAGVGRDPGSRAVQVAVRVVVESEGPSVRQGGHGRETERVGARRPLNRVRSIWRPIYYRGRFIMR